MKWAYPLSSGPLILIILQRVDPLLRNDLGKNNETTFSARQHIFNKQLYAAVTQ